MFDVTVYYLNPQRCLIREVYVADSIDEVIDMVEEDNDGIVTRIIAMRYLGDEEDL